MGSHDPRYLTRPIARSQHTRDNPREDLTVRSPQILFDATCPHCGHGRARNRGYKGEWQGDVPVPGVWACGSCGKPFVGKVPPEHADRVLVTGAGGFIGGHLVGVLRGQGHTVRAVDVKPAADWNQVHDVENWTGTDLSLRENCERACRGVDVVYNLAADMGGMGFIETHKADCMLSVLISTHMLQAARDAGVRRFFYSSSACVYAADKQTEADVTALREGDAYPAMAEDGYGWEKLFTERMCRHFTEDYGLVTRVARFHNVYGPCTAFEGGREKAPAAICRKVAECVLGGGDEIEIWGDGEQTRSFMYIDDCTTGVLLINWAEGVDAGDPINLGSDELVSINQLVTTVEEVAGVRLQRRYNLDAPKGVRGRNSDNTLITNRVGWAPSVPLTEGIERTYRWIFDELAGRQ